MQLDRQVTLEGLRSGPLAPYLPGGAVEQVSRRWAEMPVEPCDRDTVAAINILQDVVDYRRALRSWFDAVRVGGHLVVVVPHAFLYERQSALPSRWRPQQKRLYTPKTLLEEIEEALAPNAYRVACLTDDDRGYDYANAPDVEPERGCSLLLALRKIQPPHWGLDQPPAQGLVQAAAPDYAFAPPATRVETSTFRKARCILALKLDHLGDFLMGISALERLRAHFPDAEITLVVGSWNADFAAGLGLADYIIAFDAFPRNSTEEEPNVNATLAQFSQVVDRPYDLAIDLRVDTDTRVLLRAVQAPLRAGIGTRVQYSFLDIFLPIDFARNEAEAAREDRLNIHAFASQGSVKRFEHRVFSQAEKVEREYAIIWGPYWRLRAGRYFFEPWLEWDKEAANGILQLDVALDRKRAVEAFVTRGETPRLEFVIDKPDTEFEFRVWAVEGQPSIDFNFFGGRLVRAGAASVLHQSEYGALLVELVAMRLARTGVLAELPA